jgi:deuterolysin
MLYYVCLSLFRTFSLSCTDDYGVCDGNVIAYTVIATTDIYYCDIFFDEVPSTELCGGTTVANRNVRGGTTLHELTHATSGTDDITYGCAADQALSASQQLDNADNYNVSLFALTEDRL